MPEGFLIVDKPGGISSHDVVGAVRRETGVRRVGHAGTLDPMATGVVVVAVGRVTRLIRFIQDLAKEYVATAVFGVATDTLDADGAVLEREPLDVDADDVRRVIPRFVGEIEQIPPMVSALKVGGERLYDVARRGEVVERQARRVVVEELEMTDFAPGPYPEVSFRVVCGRGTYVRSLADDIAGALGGRAHLSRLRRTRIGSLGLDRAVTIEDMGEHTRYILSPLEALADLASVSIEDDLVIPVSNGVRFATGPVATIPVDTPTAIVDGRGKLLAVYRRQGHEARPEVVVA